MPTPDYSRRSYWGGRHALYGEEITGEFELNRIPLSRDGYTKGKYGRYFGTGAPLFNIVGDQVDFYIRAADRKAAWFEVLRMYPEAKMYRPGKKR